MNQNEKHEYWAKHIKQWQASKQSQQKYCEQNAIKYNTFVYWKGILKEPVSVKKKQFLPVAVISSKKDVREDSQFIQVQLISGQTVCIPVTFSTKRMAKLIKMLGTFHA